MYIYKNKALSFLETIISISIALFISTFSFIFIKSMSTTFHKINANYQKEKEIIALKSLLYNHIYWAKNIDFRLINIRNSDNLPSFYQLFNKSSETEANTLVIKYNFYGIQNTSTKEKEIYTAYRSFSFYNSVSDIKNFTTFYYDEYDSFRIDDTKESATISKNIQGNFKLENNILKLIYKDLNNGETYEIILFSK